MKKILVIDDQEDITLSVQTILQSKYEVVCINDGEDAVSKIDSERFDLILLDIMMPGVDGWTVLDHIRNKSNPNQTTKVLILSALTDQFSKNKAQEQTSGYIEKPLDNNELLNKVAQFI